MNDMSDINKGYKFSLYENLFSVKQPQKTIDIQQLYDTIQGDSLREPIEKIRTAFGNKELYSKLKQSTPVRLGQPNEAQLLISHPNYSGLQMDQVTRHYIPAHYVQDVRISYGNETIMTVEGAISLSEDPSFHFSFVPEGPGALSVEVRDTEDAVFTQTWPVEPEAGS